MLEQLHTPAPSSPNSSCTVLSYQALRTAEIHVERNIYVSGISEKSVVNTGENHKEKKKTNNEIRRATKVKEKRGKGCLLKLLSPDAHDQSPLLPLDNESAVGYIKLWQHIVSTAFSRGFRHLKLGTLPKFRSSCTIHSRKDSTKSEALFYPFYFQATIYEKLCSEPLNQP